MKFALPRLTKPSLFAWLMALSLLLSLMPAGGKRWMAGILQPLGFIEWMLTGVAHNVRSIATDISQPPLTAEQSDRLRDEVEELRRRIGYLGDENEELRRQIARLTGLADQLRDTRAQIIIAPILGGSATPRRDELTISKGDFAGVRIGDWVAAAAPSGKSPTDASGRELLTRQWLVGRIVDVQPYQSRVRLITDADFGPERVVPARIKKDGTWERAEQEALLYGEGRGEARIKGVQRNYFEDGFDQVLVPLGALRSTAMLAGRITGSQSRQDSALLVDLRVAPVGDATTLMQVYVISIGAAR